MKETAEHLEREPDCPFKTTHSKELHVVNLLYLINLLTASIN